MDEQKNNPEEQNPAADIPRAVAPTEGMQEQATGESPGSAAAVPPTGEAAPATPPDAVPDLTMAEAMAAESGGVSDDASAPVDMPGGLDQVQPVEMVSLSPAEKAERKSANINLLMDVNLPVSIELGRTRMTISDILELGSGSIVELDKLAGEPVDILVNNKPLAKGEVVVLDENFGVRITSLVSPRERLERLKS